MPTATQRRIEAPRHAAFVRVTHWLTVFAFLALLVSGAEIVISHRVSTAWGMNDGDLPVSFGGPLRMRVPRQLGYKSVKYIVRLTATDSLKSFGRGLGSAAPEAGYAWYAGI